MTFSPNLDQMTPEQLRALAAQALQLQSQVEAMSKKIQSDETIIEQLTYEIALLKRHKFAKRSEQISPAQGSLLDDLLDTDLEAIEAELKQLLPVPPQAEPRQSPKRSPLPPQFPRTVIRHEPENTQCACGCQLQRIGEDVSEKLDYTPGVFTVEQHVRGKWACRQCETLIQSPVPAQVIDKGIPTAGLLAHVMVAKFADHLPLYRQERIFGRAGLPIARSTLAQWVGQTGVRLQPLVDALREHSCFTRLKAHIGVDEESGLVHSVVGTAANVADVTQVDKLLHGVENVVCADAGYTGVEKRSEHAGREVIWQVAARRSTYRKLGKNSPLYKAKRKIEKAKAQVRAKVEHPFRVIKCQFGYVKVRFRGLAKNTAQLMTLFALSNLWMARRHLIATAGEVRL